MPQRRTLQERFEPRLKGRLFAGTVIGVLVGGALGLVVGILVFDRTGAVIAATLGGVIAGLLYGALVGSYSSLESPDPGREPSDTERPIADRSALVREESAESQDANELDPRNGHRG